MNLPLILTLTLTLFTLLNPNLWCTLWLIQDGVTLPVLRLTHFISN